jgi:hypothetical protein
MGVLSHIAPPDVRQLELEPLELLDELGGPVAFRVPGRDRSRCRGLVTLLHGNEPSGFMGLRAWLRRGEAPAIDLLCILGSIEAARRRPGFAHRMLPGQRDLNRCFHGPADDPRGRLAAEILAALDQARCETVIDLHNNTGPNPSYGVIEMLDRDRLGLVGLFTERCVVTALRLGALFEATDHVPSVVVECGQAGDPRADRVALEGIARYAAADHIPEPPAQARVYDASRRVTIRDGVRVAFAETPDSDCDVTFLPAVERYNFDCIPAGTIIGWSRGPWPLCVTDGEGRDLSRELFEVTEGQLRARRALMPIMVTANPTVAKQDCLCYLLREHGGGG